MSGTVTPEERGSAVESGAGDAGSGARETYTGQSIERVEDYDILTAGTPYVHDLGPADCLEMAVVRSGRPHAKIVSIDTSHAEAHPDCALVLTAEDLKEHYQPTPGRIGFTEWALADGKVRFVGEPVAIVVATDRYAAEDVAELVDVDYETLPPVPNVERAQADDVLLHEERGSNTIYDETFDFGDVDAAFESAAHVVTERVSWGRISGVPLETAGVVASYDSDDDQFEIDCNLQLFTFNGELVYESLGYPAEKVTLRVPDNVGGSYGTKIAAGARYCALAAMASHQLERPVRFVEDRIEYMLGGDAHSCEREYDLRLAVDDDGRITALDVEFVDDLGAFPRYPIPQAAKPLSILTTSYAIPNVRYAFELVVTNKVPQTAYRGFGTQQHTYALEMVVDAAARELGLDPTEFRLRNLIRSEQMPYTLPSGNVYDSGDYPAALRRIEALVDEERRPGGLLDPDVVEAKRAEGKYRGVQPAVTLEPSAGLIDYAGRFEMSAEELSAYRREDVNFFPEHVEAELREDGTVRVDLATASCGQGHRTVVAQMLADGLGLTPADVEVGVLDSTTAPKEFGAAASRMGVMLSGAALGLAEAMAERLREVGAQEFGCAVDDVTYDAGVVVHEEAGDRLHLVELATSDHDTRVEYDYVNPALENPIFDGALVSKHPTYPATAYSADAPIVEVDANTGAVTVLKYVSLHDCGTVLNPAIVEGQVQGAIAHGLGAALLEEFAYDESANPLATTLFDYRLPSIGTVPEMELHHEETPSPFTARGVKGAGEGGTIAASATVPASINAALAPLGVTVSEVPATPDRIRRAIREQAGKD